MSGKYCGLTTIRRERKPGTKTRYQVVSREEETIDQETYDRIVDAAPFFRRLGGSEYLERSYTKKGYLVTRILSKSPDRESQIERIFNFKD